MDMLTLPVPVRTPLGEMNIPEPIMQPMMTLIPFIKFILAFRQIGSSDVDIWFFALILRQNKVKQKTNGTNKFNISIQIDVDGTKPVIRMRFEAENLNIEFELVVKHKEI